MPADPLGRFRARARPFTATVLVTVAVPDGDGAADDAQALTMAQLTACGAEQRSQVPAMFDGKYGAAPSPDVIVRLG